MDELRIALVQADTKYDSVSGNLAMTEEMLEMPGNEADIYLLPELFNTGYSNAFTTKPEVMGLQTTRWMLLMANRTRAAICGSFAISEGGKTFNRMLFALPDGTTQHYDKQKVFKFSGEDKVFSAGENATMFEYLGWRIKPIICFDLRFPEVVRNHEPFYDLILCSAHWPKSRIQAWDQLLIARSIENQCFLAAVNRFGTEGDAFYPGHSVGTDYMGTVICRADEAPCITSFTVSKSDLKTFRDKFPFLEN